MNRTQIMLPEPLLKKIKAEADVKGVSKSEIIRRILDDWAEKKIINDTSS